MDVAVYFRNMKIPIKCICSNQSYVGLQLDNFNMVVGYISPNIGIASFTDSILDLCRKYIILGDINIKLPQWRSPTADERRDYLTEEMAAHNTSGKPTFIREDTFIRGATSKHAPQMIVFKYDGVENNRC